MKIESRFKRELEKLLFDRAHPIFRELEIRKISKYHDWTKKYREERIQGIWEIAERMLLPKAKKEFENYTFSQRLKRYKGPKDEMGDALFSWAKENYPKGPILYIFWKKDKCVYVGTGNDYKRIGTYKKSKYMDRSEADSLEIYSIRGKSNRPKVECLACHIYAPKDNLKKPGKPKYSKKCYICHKRTGVRSSLRALLD